MGDPNTRDNEQDIYDVKESVEETYADRYPDEFEEEEAESQHEEDAYQEPDESEEEVYRTQEDVDRAIKNRLKREQKKVAKELGDISIEEAREWIEAGRSISQASGLTPAQIKMKLEEQKMQQAQAGNQPYQPQDDVKKELAEMRSLIQEDRVEKVRRQQEQEARKEFGDHYQKYRDDIEDRAEELGLSLVDAAAIVLRPKLQEITEDRVRSKQQVKKTRKVEDSSEGPDKSQVDFRTALTNGEKRVAQKMGLTLEQYYEQKKSLGEIE